MWVFVLKFSAINGWIEPRLGQEMVHCRTVNTRGGLGKNLALDLKNEYFNNEFKGKVNNLL